MDTKQALVPREQNRGINSSLGPQNDTIKGGEGSQQKGGIFEREIKKSRQETIMRTLSNSRENSEISFGIPETDTIAHTWIQEDSNFTSLKGQDSYQSL